MSFTFFLLPSSFVGYLTKIDCWCFKINIYFPMRDKKQANNRKMEIYTGSHTYNTSQLNYRQVFGNHQFTKQTKCLNSLRWSPSQHILAYFFAIRRKKIKQRSSQSFYHTKSTSQKMSYNSTLFNTVQWSNSFKLKKNWLKRNDRLDWPQITPGINWAPY